MSRTPAPLSSDEGSSLAKLRWEKLPTYSYPPELIERCQRLRKVHSQQATATILGVSKSWVARIEARGFKIGKAGRPLPDRPGDFAIQCNVMSMHELAAHYGACLATVRKWLVGIDRTFRPRRVYSQKPVPPRDELIAEIAARGMHGARAYYGVSGGTFSKWRAGYGLKIGKPRKRPEPRQLRSWAEDYFKRAA